METRRNHPQFCPKCRRHYEPERQVCPQDGTRLLAIPLTYPRAGNVFDSRYVLLEVVGKGGMATIYRGFDIPNHRLCAVKVLKTDYSLDDHAVSQFFTEARVVARLGHPNIVSVYDFGRTHVGYLFIAMELLTGRTLAQTIRSEGPLPPARAIRIFEQIVDALAAAHAQGTIHRDLKPENVFLCGPDLDQVKLLDFGIAQLCGLVQRGSTDVCGTPAYMSPEQIRGQAARPESDLYSAGIVFFEMLTGRKPFVGDSPHDTMRRHITEPAPRVRHVSPALDISDAVEHLVLRLMQKDSQHRFESAARLRIELAALTGRLLPDPSVCERAPIELLLSCPAGEATHVISGRDGPGLPFVPIRLGGPAAIELDDDPVPVPGWGPEMPQPAAEPEMTPHPDAHGERCSLLHVRFALPGATGAAAAIGIEAGRQKAAADIEAWQETVERLGGAVCYDSGSEMKVLFGYGGRHPAPALAAIQAARALSAALSGTARESSCNVRMGIATGFVYGLEGSSGPVDWLLKGSEVDFAVRLSRVSPVGEVIICQQTFADTRQALKVRELSRLKARGGRIVATFLVEGLHDVDWARPSPTAVLPGDETVPPPPWERLKPVPLAALRTDG